MSANHPITLVTVLTPITPGREPELATYLNGLPKRYPKSFNELPCVHFARWVIIGQIPSEYNGRRMFGRWLQRPLRMKYLLFSSAFNCSGDAFFEDVRERLGPLADGVWDHCVGYPGSANRAEFHDYMAHNNLPIVQKFIAYDYTVAQIVDALALRKQHIELAQETQTKTDPEQLHQMFEAEFGTMRARADT